MVDRAGQIADFLDRAGWADAAAKPLAGDLSSRNYLRLRQPGGARAILMDAAPEFDGSVPAFLSMTEWLAALGLSVPEVLCARAGDGLLLLEDFGDAKLTGLLETRPEKRRAYYHRAVEVLLVIRAAAPKVLNRPAAEKMVEDTKLADAWYPGADRGVLAEFQAVLKAALEEMLTNNPGVSLRDFHTDNIIWLAGREGVRKVGLLDYQDAFLCHPTYDLMSLLTDARTDVPRALRSDMIAHYATRTNEAPEVVAHAVAVLGAQRNLRILGIFARAAKKYGKPQHLNALPRVYGYLAECLGHPAFSDFSGDPRAMLPAPDAALIERLRA